MCVADLARIEAVVWNLVPRRDEGSAAEMEVLSTQMECDEKIIECSAEQWKERPSHQGRSDEPTTNVVCAALQATCMCSNDIYLHFGV